jgi:hypothetical protein
MKNIYDLQAIKNKEFISCKIIVEDEGRDVKLTYKSNGLELFFVHEYPFFALVNLRSLLEESETFILCNGSRKDVYPSGNTASGYLAYIMKMGKPAKKLINIFESTNDIEKIVSVNEQKQYRDMWLKSF